MIINDDWRENSFARIFRAYIFHMPQEVYASIKKQDQSTVSVALQDEKSLTIDYEPICWIYEIIIVLQKIYKLLQ